MLNCMVHWRRFWRLPLAAQPRGVSRVLVPGLNREHLFLVVYYRWLRGQDATYTEQVSGWNR